MVSAFHQKRQVTSSTLGMSLSKKKKYIYIYIRGKGLPTNQLSHTRPPKSGSFVHWIRPLHYSKDAEHLNSQSSHLLTKQRTSRLMIS